MILICLLCFDHLIEKHVLATELRDSVNDDGTGPEVYIYYIDINEDRRRQGLVRKVLEAVNTIARRNGVFKITLEPDNSGGKAAESQLRQMYEHLGFRPTGRGRLLEKKL